MKKCFAASRSLVATIATWPGQSAGLLPTNIKSLFLVPLVAAVAGTASAAASVQVKVENKCGTPARYTIQKKGSSLSTSLSPRASTTHSLDVGDQIMVGKSVMHTVSSSSASQPVVVCNK